MLRMRVTFSLIIATVSLPIRTGTFNPDIMGGVVPATIGAGRTFASPSKWHVVNALHIVNVATLCTARIPIVANALPLANGRRWLTRRCDTWGGRSCQRFNGSAIAERVGRGGRAPVWQWRTLIDVVRRKLLTTIKSANLELAKPDELVRGDDVLIAVPGVQRLRCF